MVTWSELKGGAQERLTERDVKANVSGLPGASGTPEKGTKKNETKRYTFHVKVQVPRIFTSISRE